MSRGWAALAVLLVSCGSTPDADRTSCTTTSDCGVRYVDCCCEFEAVNVAFIPPGRSQGCAHGCGCAHDSIAFCDQGTCRLATP